jgi:hypothetical protein
MSTHGVDGKRTAGALHPDNSDPTESGARSRMIDKSKP